MSEENKTAPQVLSPLSALFRGMGRNLILRGIIETIIGIMLLVNPFGTVKVLTIIIGVMLILEGLTLFCISARANGGDRTWTVINAIILTVLGVVTVCSPLVMDQLWIIALGVWQIISAVTELTSGGWRRPWGILSGILSFVVGVLFIVLPFVGLSAICLIAGCVLTASGILAIFAGTDLRRAGNNI